MSLITELRAELDSAHLRQQAGRILRITAVAAVAQVTALGTAHLDRTALTAAAVGVVEAVYRQVVPVTGWGPLVRALAGRLHLPGGTAAAPLQAPPAAPVTLVPPATTQPTTAVAPTTDGPVSAPGSGA
jgi:hypothetical protein